MRYIFVSFQQIILSNLTVSFILRRSFQWCWRIHVILGDPGAVSGVGRKGGMKVFKYGLFWPQLETFVPPFLPTRLTALGSLRMDSCQKSKKKNRTGEGLFSRGAPELDPNRRLNSFIKAVIPMSWCYTYTETDRELTRGLFKTWGY